MDNISLSDDRVLNNLPKLDSFLGVLDVKTGSFVIAAICVLHPMMYGCTFFMPMSYLLVTIWMLLTMFFAASVMLFTGLIIDDALLIDIWIWFTLVFIILMLLLLFLLVVHFIASNQKPKVFPVILGILWYILTVYFILVVNSHRNDSDKPGDGPAPPVAGPAPPVAGPAPPVADPARPVDDSTPPADNPAPPPNDPTPPTDDQARPADDTPPAGDVEDPPPDGIRSLGGNPAPPGNNRLGRLKRLRKASA